MTAMRDAARALALMAGCSFLAIAAPAAAQDQSVGTGEAQSADGADDIIVTATKRNQLIQDVPFSINAQTAVDIERAHANTLEDLSRNVAGLSIQNLGPGQSQVAIRGVSAGQIVRDQPGVKEQVGVYLDESVISLSLFTPDLDLFDLNRVETLRGPQGTLFGSGSVGGTVRYITNQPRTDRVEGKVQGGLNLIDGGSLGGDLKGTVNLPLSDKIAARAVGYYTRYGGFIDALREGGDTDKNVNDGYRAGGRLSVLFQPTESFSTTPRVIYQKIHTDGFNRQDVFNLFANPYTTTRPAIELEERQQYLLRDESFDDKFLLVDNTAVLNLGAVDLTSVTSYTNRNILVSRDASSLTGSVSIDLEFPDAAVLLPSNLRDKTRVNQFTQEARLSSAGENRFQWVAGAFYSNTKRRYTQRLPTPGYDAATDAALGAGTAAGAANGFGPDSPYNATLPYTLRQVAAFAEGTFDITPELHATAGARYYNYKEKRRFTSGGLFSNGDDRRDRTKSDGVTPRFLLAYEATPDITLNLQASKGFRLGGVNDPLNLPLCTPQDAEIFGGYQSYKDETLWNYEGGVKAKVGPVRVNSALFYNRIRNLQVTLDAGSCSSRVVFNVEKAHSVGLELELATSPVPGLDLGVSGSVLESEFDSTVRDGTGAVLGGIRDGNRLPTVPKFQLSANANYSFPIDADKQGFIGGSFQHIGSRFTQPSDQEGNPRSFVSGLPFGGAPGTDATVIDLRLPRYEIVNLNAGVTFPDQLEVSLYVNNLTDENALLSFDRERGGRARLGFTVNQPRTYGIALRKGF